MRQQKTGHFSQIRPLIRMVGLGGAALAICAGVTYAALQSQKAVLANNTIQTATANLQISKDGDLYDSSVGGFTFANVEPGGVPMPAMGNMFFLRNQGSIPMSIHLALDSSGLINTAQLDLSKVAAIVTPVSSNDNLGTPQTNQLSDLAESDGSGGTDLNITLPIGAAAQYKLQVSMDSDAYDGPPGTSATLSGINFAFTGVSASIQ